MDIKDIKELEAKLHELKVKQGDIFKQKKADRDAAALEAIRTEMAEVKAKVKEGLAANKASK
ncbi:hypothetical protein KMW28_20305 [Flammeovirga yaeyamensis]|uniref:50S ribosomal protein L29 n=1 Tax=Flammeovirga yaeyamensis TaxID=367791 RepID=A0AAX1N3C8_9BACT|nr:MULTISPECIES: hypothetical protein [Flammeovirga]ANQ50640.1 hypothetical protein MY04_3278 [Flammeovirga sp. MY04]MBB3700988.1 Tfp pilus assembly protein PilO [Flammeovirga yaeyamensis]NMF38178.1 hypothetical protein [Flammeovirga yaeyamensis]QWG01947.1 hypothetical protein KMW28_20305 [Flammeovirga yaeyamensis]